jgi:hypothetical protein
MRGWSIRMGDSPSDSPSFWYNSPISRLPDRELFMRKIIESDEMEEPVKRFLGSLDVSNEASVVEVNGRLVYLIVRPPMTTGREDEPWTDERDQRRNDLIDLKIDSKLTPIESVELAELDEAFDRHMNRVAPLPMEYARELLKRANEQKAQATAGA